MANKRILKKQIRYACGDLATETIMAAHIEPAMSHEKMSKIVNDIAALQTEALQRTSFSFDRTYKDFESKHAYRKARGVYNRKAFNSLKKEFGNAVAIIVKAMNEALPEERKKANVKSLNK